MWSPSTRRSVAAGVRRFSDSAGRGGGPGFGGRGGRGGRGRGGMMEGAGGQGGGQGGGGRGGRGRGGGGFDRFRGAQQQQQGRGRQQPSSSEGKFHRGGPRKENFATRYLDPAAKGQLVGKHDSGIPKLAGRRTKGNQTNDAFPGAEAQESLDHSFTQGSGRELQSSRYQDNDRSDNGAMLADALKILNPDFVDDEDDYDEIETYGFDPENHPDVYKDAEGNTVLNYDPEDPEYVFSTDDNEEVTEAGAEDEESDSNSGGGGRTDDRDKIGDPEELFFNRDIFDFEAPRPEDNVPKEIANMLLPLQVEGDGFDDFLAASFDHPSKYAEVRRYNYHPESLREAKPSFPKNRLQPPLDFITSHKRFLFVSGLPHFVEQDGTLGELENPIHRLEVSKVVADMLGVKTASVSPASMTSAFVGYKDKEDLYKFFLEGPKYNTMDRKLKMSLYTAEDDVESGFAADDAVIKLEDVPAGMSMTRLAHTLFPAGTEMGSIYGPLTVDDLKQIGTTTVLVRMKSAEQAESALSSSLVQEHMEKLGHTVVQFFRARRELQHGGRTGPNKGQTFQKRGNKLAVDTDTPPKDFLQSHAGVVQLRNVDVSFTKEQISKYLEASSADRRDVIGSIEFARCYQKDRTDIVYAGFERAGEAEAFVSACSGLMNLGKGPVTVRMVKEQWNPTTALPRESRPERSEEELLATLDKWENFVDMEQVEQLEASGVNREVFADAFRTMRFHNQSYGSLDWGMNREKLNPQNTDPGQQMRETMQLYIDTLKEVVEAEDPEGMSYEEIMTLPDDEQEEGDISGDVLVADEKERLTVVNQQRQSYFY